MNNKSLASNTDVSGIIIYKWILMKQFTYWKMDQISGSEFFGPFPLILFHPNYND